MSNYPTNITFHSKVPWGYEIVDTETRQAKAIPKEIEALKIAIEKLSDGSFSLQQATDYLNSKSERKLTKSGIIVLWEKYDPEGRAKRRNKQPNKKKKPKILSKEEKALRRKKYKIAAEKRRITNAQKRLESLAEQKQNQEDIVEAVQDYLSKPVYIDQGILDKEEIKEERPIIFEPNPGPQTLFLQAPELEVLFGGAAGGGKSYALIADPIRHFDNEHFVGLLLRRTNDELRELIWKTKQLYPQIYPNARFSEKASEWRFPSGARLWMSYLDRDEDVLRYQGQAYSWIGFDELTHWPTPYPWDYLRTRLRAAKGTGLENALAMRGTTNPGGPGHSWVKKMFIDPAPPNTPFWAQDPETGETLVDPETGEKLFRRIFIPSMLSDNPYLAEDGAYRRNLASLPERRKKQLLYGDWTVADGAAFTEFDPNIHIIEPFEIPKEWTRFRSADFGYSSFSAVHWFAINPYNNQLIVYRELYVSKMTGEALADTIIRLEQGEKISYGVLDSSVWHKRGEGPSVAEVMISRGCRWRPADRSQGSRIAGKNRLHELLKVNEDYGVPGIVFFDTCRQILNDLPAIPMDPKGGEDIDARYKNDHTYDSIRYGVMSRPKSYDYDDMQTPTYITTPQDMVFGY